MSIFQRIGEAIASQGKITLVPALTTDESKILIQSGFKKVGTMDLNGDLVDLYEVKIVQVINSQPPFNGNNTFPGKTPRKYTQEWPEWPEHPYRLLCNESKTGDTNFLYKGGSTSFTDSAYNPLSVLDDYFFNSDNDTYRSFKIEVPVSCTEAADYVEKMKTEITLRQK